MANQIHTPARLRELEDAICSYARLQHGDLYSDSRRRDIMDARQLVWAIAHQHMSYSMNLLANIYGVHYTTMRHGVLRMQKQPAYKLVMRELRRTHAHLVDGTYSNVGSIGGWDFEGRKAVD